MRFIQIKYDRTLRRISFSLLILLGVHFLSIHGVFDSLVYCFEDNGEVMIESEAGAIFTIPSEDVKHAVTNHSHDTPTYDSVPDTHSDVSLRIICSKEERITRYNQGKSLKYLKSALKTSFSRVSPSRYYQLNSFIPPNIESKTTTSLQSVVLLN